MYLRDLINRNAVLPLTVPQAANLAGVYFRAGNATPGTGIAMGIQTSYSATANVLLILYNAAASGKNVVLDFLKLINSAAGATTTSSQCVLRLDSKDRYSASGTQITAFTQPGPASASSCLSSGKLYFGACTANAEGSGVSTVGRGTLKVAAAPCWAVGDQVVFTFGTMQATAGGIAATTAGILPIYMGPIIVPPGYSLSVHVWNVANATTPPSWEFELGWWELVA
jgi:hypothetical protein